MLTTCSCTCRKALELRKYLLFLAMLLGITTGYSQVVNLDTLFAEAKIHQDEGMRFHSQGNKRKALEEFNIATDKYRDFQDLLDSKGDSVSRIFEKLQEDNRRSPVYNYLYGRILQRLESDSGRRPLSTQYFTRAVEIEPKYPWSYLALAYPYFEAKDYTTAVQYYNRALAGDSSFEFGYTRLIDSYHMMGKSEDSARIQDLLLNNYPRSNSAIRVRLETIQREENAVRKIGLCRELLLQTGGDASARMAWDQIMYTYKHDNADSMRVVCREVLGIIGQAYAKQRQIAMLLLFDDAKKKGRPAIDAIAETAFRTTDPHVLTTVGKYYLDSLKETEQALNFLTRASQYCTNQYAFNTVVIGMLTEEHLGEIANDYLSWVHYYLGLAYVRLGQNENAKDYLTRAALAGGKKKIVDANFQLGSLSVALGEQENAIKWLRRGLALQGNEAARTQLVGLVGSDETAQKLIDETRKKDERAAAQFTLYSIDGDSVRLSSFRGKVVVIDFWATWCYPCVKEMPFLQKLVEYYAGNADVEFLSISMDRSRDTVKPFIKSNNYSMKVLYDKGTSLDYGVESIPTLFLLDRTGKIQFTHHGFSGNGEGFMKMMRGEIEELLARRTESR